MSDIFKEVDEALQQEKIKSYWQQHGHMIVALVLIIILGTAAWSGYEYWRQSIDETRTEVLVEITESSENLSPASIDELQGTQKILARMILAGQALNKEKEQSQAALEQYLAILQDKAAPTAYQALAGYYARQLMLDGVGDISQFGSLAIPPETIWQPLLDYQMALFQARQEGKLTAAIEKLDEILGREDVPPPLQKQADIARRVFAFDQKQKQEVNQEEAVE